MDYQIQLITGEIGTLRVTENFKSFNSESFKYLFDKRTGFFVRFGKSEKLKINRKIQPSEYHVMFLWYTVWGEKFNVNDFICDLSTDCDPKLQICDILDIEVSTKCSGVTIDGKQQPCKFCYKSNTRKGKFMDTDKFRTIIEKMPKTLCQCALGIGDVNQSNLFELMQVCIDNDIVPNLTINGDGLTSDILDKLSKYCGAVAVSYYDKDLTFNAIYELATIRGMRQINTHFFLAEETFDKALQFLNDIKTDYRLKDMNAVVFLSLKQKGNAKINKFNCLSQDKFKILIDKALELGVRIGFDSCSCQKTLSALKDNSKYSEYQQTCDPCESTLGSAYINVDGDFYPCSFCEGENSIMGDWQNGLSVINCNDFLADIWFNDKTRLFADKTIDNRNKCNSCSIFKI